MQRQNGMSAVVRNSIFFSVTTGISGATSHATGSAILQRNDQTYNIQESALVGLYGGLGIGFIFGLLRCISAYYSDESSVKYRLIKSNQSNCEIVKQSLLYVAKEAIIFETTQILAALLGTALFVNDNQHQMNIRQYIATGALGASLMFIPMAMAVTLIGVLIECCYPAFFQIPFHPISVLAPTITTSEQDIKTSTVIAESTNNLTNNLTPISTNDYYEETDNSQDAKFETVEVPIAESATIEETSSKSEEKPASSTEAVITLPSNEEPNHATDETSSRCRIM